MCISKGILQPVTLPLADISMVKTDTGRQLKLMKEGRTHSEELDVGVGADAEAGQAAAVLLQDDTP